jgi:hypothetical protein
MLSGKTGEANIQETSFFEKTQRPITKFFLGDPVYESDTQQQAIDKSLTSGVKVGLGGGVVGGAMIALFVGGPVSIVGGLAAGVVLGTMQAIGKFYERVPDSEVKNQNVFDPKAQDLATRLSKNNPELMESLRGKTYGETSLNIKNMMEKAKLAVDYPGADFSNLNQSELDGITKVLPLKVYGGLVKGAKGLHQYTADKLVETAQLKSDDFNMHMPFDNEIQKKIRFEPKGILDKAGNFDKAATAKDFEPKLLALKKQLNEKGIKYEEIRFPNGDFKEFSVSIDFELFQKLDMNIQPSKPEDTPAGTVVKNTIDPEGSLYQQERELMQSIKTDPLNSHSVTLNGKTYEFPPLGNTFDSISAKKVDSIWEKLESEVSRLRDQKKLKALGRFEAETNAIVSRGSQNIDPKILDRFKRVLNSGLDASDRFVAAHYLDTDLYDIKQKNNGKIPDELYDLEKALQKLIDSPY